LIDTYGVFIFLNSRFITLRLTIMDD